MRIESITEHQSVVRVHEQRIMAAYQGLPNPRPVAADAPDVIRVQQADFLAVPGRRIVFVSVLGTGRDPVRRTRQHAVQSLRAVTRDPNRVLLGLAPLVLAKRFHDPPIPFLLATLVDHFVQHVVEIVDRVDHFADVGGLDLIRRRIGQAMYLFRRINSIDVVVRVEGMGAPGPLVQSASPAIAVHHPPAFEQHHGHVDATAGCGGDSRLQSFKVNRVELFQIELRLAVDRRARPCPRPRQRSGVVDKILAQFPVGPCVPGGRIPGPQPYKIVPVAV